MAEKLAESLGAAESARRWLANASLEVSARDSGAAAALRAHALAGARVHVTSLPNVALASVVAQAKALRDAGFEPVPHIAARGLASRADLDDFLARLAGEAGARRVLLIGGDVDGPRGPFAQSRDVLRTGLLQAHGIGAVGFAGHPEGHPALGAEAMDAALIEKLDDARAHGLDAEIVTQFAFEAAPIAAWIARLRARGVDAPIRVGAAAPTNPALMLKFALRCGVGPSIRALRAQSARLGRLAADAGPETLIADLARALAPSDAAAVAGLHFFVFSETAKAALWLAALQRAHGVRR